MWWKQPLRPALKVPEKATQNYTIQHHWSMTRNMWEFFKNQICITTSITIKGLAAQS